MRVGIDGLILAANDAALALLGAERAPQVLGKFLTKWVKPTHQPGWHKFVQSAANGASHSLECEITDGSGTQRNVVFDAVPLVDHPDGIPSLILGARDATALRRVESALGESEAVREKLTTEQHQPAKEDGRQTQLELLLKQGRTHLQELRSELTEARQERDRLAAQLGEREAVEGRLQTDQVQQEKARAEQQHELRLLSTQLQQVRTALDQANQARDRLAVQLGEREAIEGRLQAEHAQQEEARAEQHRRELQAMEAEHQELRNEEARLRQLLAALQHQHGIIRPKLDQAMAENQQLQTKVAELEEVQRLESAQHQGSLDALRAQLNEATTECDHLSSIRGRLEDELGAAAAQHQEREKVLADHRVELKSLVLTVKRVEPLAAAGRLATDAAHELLTSIANIEARAVWLLAECPIAATSREAVEQLRMDAARTASLARQIQQARQIAGEEQ